MTLEEALEKIDGYNKINLYDAMGNKLVKNVSYNDDISKFLNYNVIRIDLNLGYDYVNMNIYVEEK